MLPTDFSDNAYNALKYAAGLYKEELLYLAEKFNAKINVLHMVSSYELEQEKKTNKSILTGRFDSVSLEHHEVPDTEDITACPLNRLMTYLERNFETKRSHST